MPAGPLATLLAAYEARCREVNAFDFTDLLAAPLTLFDQDPAVRERLRSRFRALLVDEAQDLCALQHALVEALAAPDGAVTFAGDDDQAIYGWRGGDVTRLHAFERTYPGGTVLAVGRNYRSTPEIVATAARLIGHNRARRPKPLAAVRPAGRSPGRDLGRRPRRGRGTGRPLSGVAPDRRAPDRDPGAGDRVPQADRPSLRGTRAERSSPGGASARRARRGPRPAGGLSRARQPARLAGVGAGAARASLRRGPEDARDAPSAGPSGRRGRPRSVRPPGATVVAGRAAGSTPRLADRTATGHDTARDRRRGDPESSPGRGGTRSLKTSETAGPRTSRRSWPWRAGGRRRPAGASRSSSTPWCSPTRTPPTWAAVEVLGLTLHAAKGLEFDTVVIVGAEDGLIPHYRHTAAETLAEERRLCYVGMTRARQHLIFSVARMRRLWGDVAFRPPSRFLREAGLTVVPALPSGTVAPAEVTPR